LEDVTGLADKSIGSELRKIFSDENLEKPARLDLELFQPVKAEYPCLSPYEESVFEQLKSHYRLLGKLFQVASENGGVLYTSTLVINGAIVRSLNTYRGALWALGNGNPHVFFDCLRSQCETLAFLHHCTSNPDYIKAATIGSRNDPDKDLKIPNILTMVNKLDKIHNGICKDYDQLCNLVHPNPASLYASVHIIDEKERVVAFTTRLPKMPDEKAKLHLVMLMTWTKWILDETLELAKIFYANKQ
jgi:hypothetical protein